MATRLLTLTILLAFAVGIIPGCSSGTYVDAPPPDDQTEVKPAPPPGRNVVWVPGHFQWVNGSYKWKPGYWIKGKPNKVYVPGHWKHTRRGYQWIPGHWK